MFLALLGLAAAPTDKALVHSFVGGDVDAFSQLVERYQDRVFTLCYRNLNDRQEAEEVAQEVFIALYRSLSSFRGESKLSTWVYRVTVNHCKNRRLYQQRRGAGRHEPLEGTRGDDAPPRQLPSNEPGTDRSTHRSEAERLLNLALNQMEDHHRSILVLRDIHDLSYQEISEALDLPRGTVKSRLHRARLELARLLERHVAKEDVLP
jgi:RNA polymerase sigma-70 factor (ECF subfamily)